MWSYLLSAAGITGLLVAARHPRAGWTINICAQGLWAVYAITTDQYGFVLAAAAYTVAYVRLLRRAGVAQPTHTVDSGRYGARVIRARLTLPAALLAIALAVAGCGADDAPLSAPSPTTPAAAPTSAPPAATTPAAAASPTTDPNAPHRLGSQVTLSARADISATVYAYRQPVAKGAPQPEEQAGYVWGAADVKVCLGKAAAESVSVSHGPWVLSYADDTTIAPSSTGYRQFPEPEYPWGDKVLAPGRCIRGWITFPVPGKIRPAYVEYAPEDVTVPVRWAVK